jgi:hypothetical protein
MRSFHLSGLLFKFLAWFMVFILPIRPALIAAAALVFADLISGVWASLKEGNKLTSSGLRRSVIKLLSYMSAIVMGFVIENYLLDGMPVVKTITGLIGVTEGKSFFENLRRITGIDFWSELISKLNLPDVKRNPDEPK